MENAIGLFTELTLFFSIQVYFREIIFPNMPETPYKKPAAKIRRERISGL